jgi:uncharacterized protein (TIGR00730 family)
VYGGASVGLMGVVADAALAAGGRAYGVIPRHLVDRELSHPGLTELHVTTSMHERKALMADLAEGFVALPGGFGTLEELAEITTWAQLGLHTKPIGVLDVRGFYTLLLRLADHMVEERFVRPDHRDLLISAAEPAQLLTAMQEWRPVTVPKWVPPEAR